MPSQHQLNEPLTEPGLDEQFVPADVLSRTDQAATKDERAALDAFLSVDPNRQKDVAHVRVPSLNTVVIVRELDERELNDINERHNPTPVPGRRAPSVAANQLDWAADIVAMALVDPNLHDDDVLAKFNQRFGTGVSIANVVRRVMKPLELGALAAVVVDLSGAGEDGIEVVGN